ncbi:DUF5701 family protein [Gordonia caeni]|uniref:DUF5701 family protein n=1 Tax=Gordonia caeni TaxID=1007097 RepID=A0ABP7NZJ5_9ACTN
MAERPPLPSLADQAAALVDLGVHDLIGMRPAEFVSRATELEFPGQAESLLAVDPALAPPSVLAPLMRLPGHGVPGGKAGFVVADMTDVDSFAPIDGIDVPAGPLYAVAAPDRGDEFADRSPVETLPEILAAGRTPLLLNEAVTWALQTPAVVEPNHCFMAIGSRARKPDGTLDSRTPAVWISGGTGRDGAEAKGAPKVGWCWAGNRHTWLGIASAAGRIGTRTAE